MEHNKGFTVESIDGLMAKAWAVKYLDNTLAFFSDDGADTSSLPVVVAKCLNRIEASDRFHEVLPRNIRYRLWLTADLKTPEAWCAEGMGPRPKTRRYTIHNVAYYHANDVVPLEMLERENIDHGCP